MIVMKTNDIIKEIEKLTLTERRYLIERVVRILRKEEEANQMMEAANVLREDYLHDRDLTAFTDLDMESFYEAR